MKYKKVKIAPYVKVPVIITGGWSGFYSKPNNSHLAYDMKGGRTPKYKVYAGLDGKIVKPTSIKKYKPARWLDEYGFALACDSNEYIFYNHCVSKYKVGTKVKRGQEIGKMDTIARQRALRKKWGANPNAFTGRHLHVEVIASDQMTPLNPLDYMERVKLGGQYAKKQYRDNPDRYIYIKLDEEEMYKQKYNDLKKKYDKLKKENASLKKRVTQGVQKLEKLTKEYKKYKKDLATQIDALQDQIEVCNKKLGQFAQEIAKKDEKIDNQSKQITNLEKKLQDCKGEDEEIDFIGNILNKLKGLWKRLKNSG